MAGADSDTPDPGELDAEEVDDADVDPEDDGSKLPPPPSTRRRARRKTKQASLNDKKSPA